MSRSSVQRSKQSGESLLSSIIPVLKSEATLRALPSDLDDPLERMMTEDDKKAVKGSDSRGQDFCKNMLNEDLQISSDFCDL